MGQWEEAIAVTPEPIQLHETTNFDVPHYGLGKSLGKVEQRRGRCISRYRRAIQSIQFGLKLMKLFGDVSDSWG